MLPMLFDALDADSSGAIDRYELTSSMNRLIDEGSLSVAMDWIINIMREVDLDNDEQLDRREFGAFLNRVAAVGGTSLDSLTRALMRQRETDSKKRLARLRRSHDDSKGAREGWSMMNGLFDTWDVDNSGSIDRHELSSGMGRLIRENGLDEHITGDDVLRIMREVDLDDDEHLDRREFACFLSRLSVAADISLDGITHALMAQREVEAQRQLERFERECASLERAWVDIPRVFAAWDADGDGYVDREEVALAANRYLCSTSIRKVTLEECLQLMDEVDENGDRVLDAMEFGAFMGRFALAAGETLDRLTSFFLEEQKRNAEQTQSAQAVGRFGRFFSRASIGFAEESLEAKRRHEALRHG